MRSANSPFVQVIHTAARASERVESSVGSGEFEPFARKANWAALGEARLANNLNQLAKAANMGTLEVSSDTETQLQEACEDRARDFGREM